MYTHLSCSAVFGAAVSKNLLSLELVKGAGAAGAAPGAGAGSSDEVHCEVEVRPTCSTWCCNAACPRDRAAACFLGICAVPSFRTPCLHCPACMAQRLHLRGLTPWYVELPRARWTTQPCALPALPAGLHQQWRLQRQEDADGSVYQWPLRWVAQQPTW